MSSRPDDKWLYYCALTCIEGSEQKGCECTGPDDCKLKAEPDFEAHRRMAVFRLHQRMKKPFNVH